MKNKFKIIILIFLIIISSGCTVNYDLEFKNDKIKETVTITENNIDKLHSSVGFGLLTNIEMCNKINDTPIVSVYDKNIDNISIENNKVDKRFEYYKPNNEVNDSLCKLNYSYTFTTSNYKNSFAASQGFKHFNFSEYGDTYIISTTRGIDRYNEYTNLDKVVVHIYTNHKVINNNADRVDGENYYWEFSRNDNEKNVYIMVSKNQLISNGILAKIVIIIYIAIVVALLLFAIRIYTKYKKNN